jgi:hypothetical protein
MKPSFKHTAMMPSIRHASTVLLGCHYGEAGSKHDVRRRITRVGPSLPSPPSSVMLQRCGFAFQSYVDMNHAAGCFTLAGGNRPRTGARRRAAHQRRRSPAHARQARTAGARAGEFPARKRRGPCAGAWKGHGLPPVVWLGTQRRTTPRRVSRRAVSRRASCAPAALLARHVGGCPAAAGC